MAIINEIQIGSVPNYNGMTMFRKYNAKLGFQPIYIFIDDNTMSLESKVIINYIEYFKNENGNIITELTRYKNYTIPNIPATYKQDNVEVSPIVYYNQGDIITPSYDDGDGNIIDAVVATGTEIKIAAEYELQQVLDKPEWLAANGWFMSMARTPITAQFGVMDAIEATLAEFPINIPNGYVLQTPD